MPEEYSGERPNQVLRRANLKPRKQLGQNFLQARRFIHLMLDAAEIEESDSVVEVGAGTGVMTQELVRRAGLVTALELDDSLVRLLQSEFASASKLTVWHGNALHFDPCERVEGPYKLLGNIPYYITGPLLRHFLETRCAPTTLVLMVQREVATRISAPAGRLSLLGVSVQYYAEVKVVARVPASAFHPRPKVDSAIIRLSPHLRRPPEAERKIFFETVRAGFSSPRKQIANSLAHGLGLTRDAAAPLLQGCAIEPVRRPETLTVGEWQRLAAAWAHREGQE